jgi:hypothetical protein
MFAYAVQCVIDQLDQKKKEKERSIKRKTNIVSHLGVVGEQTERKRKEYTKNDYASGQSGRHQMVMD